MLWPPLCLPAPCLPAPCRGCPLPAGPLPGLPCPLPGLPPPWVPPARLEQARRNGQKALHVKLPPPSEKQAALGRHLMDIRSTFVDLRNKGKCRGLAKGMVEELRKSMEALSGAILRDGLNKLQADGEIEWVEVPGEGRGGHRAGGPQVAGVDQRRTTQHGGPSRQ